MNTVDGLTRRLHDIVDGEPDSAPPIGLLLARGRRARRGRATAVAGAMCTVLALGVAAGVSLATGPKPTDPGVGGAAATPQVELVAAVAASQNISFKVKTTAEGRKSDGKMTTPPEPARVTESAFDPATLTGYSRSADGRSDLRLIDGVKYSKNPAGGGQYFQYPGKYDSLSAGVYAELSGSADAERLFQALRASDAKITKLGADRYHFEATGAEDGGVVKLVGDITLNADKRVAMVAYEWTLTYAQGGFRTYTAKLEFSDYGLPVTVERPTNVVIVD